jgi:hypothetical protein
MRRGVVGVSTFGIGAGAVFASFAGEGVPFDAVVVGDGDLPKLAGEGDLPFACRRGVMLAMTSATPCFCPEVREAWTSGDLESSSNSAME